MQNTSSLQLYQCDDLVICIEGCMHGELNTVYDSVKKLEQQNQVKIDLLINCGDFEAIRNQNDLLYMKVPEKYRTAGDFPSYYSGEKKVPYLTVFIGGNHEASNYLKTLPFGGYVAKDIYYMGATGILIIEKNNKQYRIGGISGIYNWHSFQKDRNYEQLPLKVSDITTAYHYRPIDIIKLAMYTQQLDIMLSHDWPARIYNFGDKAGLLRVKKHFQKDIQSQSLGSPPLEFLIQNLMPLKWYSAHMHVKFVATLQENARVCSFMALDKCLPKRAYLEMTMLTAGGGGEGGGGGGGEEREKTGGGGGEEREKTGEEKEKTGRGDGQVKLKQCGEWLNICRKFEMYYVEYGAFPKDVLEVRGNRQPYLNHQQFNRLLKYLSSVDLKQFSDDQLLINSDFKKIDNGIFNYQTDQFLDLLDIKRTDYYKQFNKFYEQMEEKKKEQQEYKKNKEINDIFYQDKNEIDLDLSDSIEIKKDEFIEIEDRIQEKERKEDKNKECIRIEKKNLPFK